MLVHSVCNYTCLGAWSSSMEIYLGLKPSRSVRENLRSCCEARGRKDNLYVMVL